MSALVLFTLPLSEHVAFSDSTYLTSTMAKIVIEPLALKQNQMSDIELLGLTEGIQSRMPFEQTKHLISNFFRLAGEVQDTWFFVEMRR